MHISSSYAKILGEKLFRTWEIPRSGSKAEDGEERERERKLVKTMAKLRMAHASTHGARKPPGPIKKFQRGKNIDDAKKEETIGGVKMKSCRRRTKKSKIKNVQQKKKSSKCKKRIARDI